MKYKFNKFGWFTGLGNGPRSTKVPPPTLSLDETPGIQRANFIGVPGQEWEVWLYTPPPADEPPEDPAPQSVSMADFRIALLAAGLDRAVAATIAAYPNGKKARVTIRWEYETEVRLHSGVSQDLGLTQAQLRQLFRATL